MRGSRRKMQERPDGVPGAPACAKFQNLTQQDQRGDNGGSLEIDGHNSILVSKRRREELRKERRNKAVKIGGTGAKANQGEHVGAAIDERCPEALDEGPATPKYDR